jgi:hypothetical protein
MNASPSPVMTKHRAHRSGEDLPACARNGLAPILISSVAGVQWQKVLRWMVRSLQSHRRDPSLSYPSSQRAAWTKILPVSLRPNPGMFWRSISSVFLVDEHQCLLKTGSSPISWKFEAHSEAQCPVQGRCPWDKRVLMVTAPNDRKMPHRCSDHSYALYRS